MAKKLILDCDDKLWNEVLKYRIDAGLKNNNQAVIELLRMALKGYHQKTSDFTGIPGKI